MSETIEWIFRAIYRDTSSEKNNDNTDDKDGAGDGDNDDEDYDDKHIIFEHVLWHDC